MLKDKGRELASPVMSTARQLHHGHGAAQGTFQQHKLAPVPGSSPEDSVTHLETRALSKCASRTSCMTVQNLAAWQGARLLLPKSRSVPLRFVTERSVGEKDGIKSLKS